MDNILLLPDNEEKPNESKNKPKLFTSSAVLNCFIFGASLILSVVVLFMFFSAADLIKNGGLDIMSIESVGGRTLEEAYYHGLGYVYEGYYSAVRATGVFCSSLLLLFGISRLKMSSSKRIASFIIFIVLLAGLCGCDTEFDEAREKIEENRFIRQESKLLTSDLEVQNVEIDYSQSSSYSNYLHVVGLVKNKSNKKASSITLTLYLYQNDSLVLTEKEYVFDLGPYDRNSFDFLIDRVKLLTCDEYTVRVTDVF